MTTKKQFKDLKQLDRIEYLLAERKVKDSYYSTGWISLVYWWVVFVTGVTAYAFLLMPNYPEATIKLLKIVPMVYPVFKWVIIILIVWQVLVYIKYYENKRKLKEHFKL